LAPLGDSEVPKGFAKKATQSDSLEVLPAFIDLAAMPRIDIGIVVAMAVLAVGGTTSVSPSARSHFNKCRLNLIKNKKYKT
jgi:hypothetical protein